MVVKMANLVACFPLISWVNSKRQNKVSVKQIARTDQTHCSIFLSLIFLYFAMLLTSFISSSYIWSSLISNN